MATAFKGASSEIQQKLRRVVEVWRQRQIFEEPIQEAVEARVEGLSILTIKKTPHVEVTNPSTEVDKSRSSGKKPLLGGSLFSSSSGTLPPELQPLAPLQVAVSKSAVSSSTAVTNANTEYDKLHDPSSPLPTPPVHAARLTQLLKSLASAENSVSEIMKSRQNLIQGLEKLLETNRSALEKEESQSQQLSTRKIETETKKREVEDAIMRGLSVENSPADNGDGNLAAQYNKDEDDDIERPEVEALTPPPVESLTPVTSPKENTDATAQQTYSGLDSVNDHTSLAFQSTPAVAGQVPSAPGADLLASLAALHEPPHSNGSPNGSSAKKRKVGHGDDGSSAFEGNDAMADLDDDVAELLRQEGNKY